MPYREDTNARLYTSAHPPQERGSYADAHDGGSHDPTHRIDLARIEAAMRETTFDVAKLDKMFGRPTSGELAAVAEAALLILERRGGVIGEAAADVLYVSEDAWRHFGDVLGGEGA